MQLTPETDRMFGDYAALLRGILPALDAFHCFGLDGAPVAGSGGENPSVADDSRYRAAVAAMLAQSSPPPTRLDLGSAVAFLFPLHDERRATTGVFSIVARPEIGDMSAEACFAAAGPVMRLLDREIQLRFRILEAQRKLSVQAAEEGLLHDVERTAHREGDCLGTLEQVLAICRQYLDVEYTALLAPEKRIALFHGTRLTRAEVELMLDDAEPGNMPEADAEPGRWTGTDLYAVPLRERQGHEGQHRTGMLVFAGWPNADFSERRRSRVMHYVRAHIEWVIARSFDRLTGLMAFPEFERTLAAAAAMGNGDGHAVMYCDIDRLHVVNDTLGRDTGDQVIAHLAELLRSELQGHLVTRITSDSFAALLLDTDLETARRIAEGIVNRFREREYSRGDQTFRPSVSIGIGPLLSDSSMGGTGPLATAEVACGAAKDRGRGRIEVYQAEDPSIIQRFDDIQLVGYVRSAIERSRLCLLGQPIVGIRDGAVDHYYEVLVRLLDDEGQHVPPGDFLSAAERYQLMEELDRWVVANTLQLLGSHISGLKEARARFAINLSGQSLGSEQFLPFLQNQIERSGIPPQMLCFEITETVAVANLQRAQTLMHALRRTGCRFSLDDFGTGLSSFAYLKLFPVDTLKIDGSFIRDVETNVVSQSVVAAISEVARVMHLETVAEFVETQASLDLLRKLGIGFAQGYLVGEPLDLQRQLDRLLESPAVTAASAAAPRTGPPVRGHSTSSLIPQRRR